MNISMIITTCTAENFTDINLYTFEATHLLLRQVALIRQSPRRNKDLIPMQYTGLKDKNGKEIYHKDCVAMFYGTQKSEVFWEDGAFWVVCQISGGHDAGKELLCNIAGECEVIGNIYENPELLEGK